MVLTLRLDDSIAGLGMIASLLHVLDHIVALTLSALPATPKSWMSGLSYNMTCMYIPYFVLVVYNIMIQVLTGIRSVLLISL